MSIGVLDPEQSNVWLRLCSGMFPDDYPCAVGLTTRIVGAQGMARASRAWQADQLHYRGTDRLDFFEVGSSLPLRELASRLAQELATAVVGIEILDSDMASLLVGAPNGASASLTCDGGSETVVFDPPDESLLEAALTTILDGPETAGWLRAAIAEAGDSPYAEDVILAIFARTGVAAVDRIILPPPDDTADLGGCVALGPLQDVDARFVYGWTDDAVGVWDRQSPQEPLAHFPRSREGLRDARLAAHDANQRT